MNIQNISALADQLQTLGFDIAGYSLLKRICFKPDSFFLSQKMLRGKDQLSFHLYFDKEVKMGNYCLMYYDAILQKERALSNILFNGIDINALEKRMEAIDWKLAFDSETKNKWDAENIASWENEQKIESIVEELKLLESIDEGKVVAAGLRHTFWTGISYQELVGNISPLKNNSGIIQRFYFFEGETGISVDEAYRFLQNKWLEKQVLAKRKQSEGANEEENNGNEKAPSAGGSLIKKRRLNKVKTGKSKNVIQK